MQNKIPAYILFIMLFFSLANANGQSVTDTYYHVTMKPVNIVSERQWKNDTVRYHYNQMKYYVTTILPYLDQAVTLFNEIDIKINTPGIAKRERKAFVKIKEDELREKFDDEIKQLNETQGLLLIKLIARQTGINIYAMLQEFKGPLAAIKWQGWSKLHGFNLNTKYNPDEEPWLEDIMDDLGYPLPAIYGQRQILTAN